MATLNVTHTESITLNGQEFGGTNTFSITGINNIYKRIVTCPANVDTTILRTGVTVDVTDSSMDVQNVKYIRVTNLDSSNSLTLSLQAEVGEDDSGADVSASILLEAGKSFMMGSGHDGIGVSDANANIVTDLVDLDSLVVQPGSNAISVEVFVASV